MKKNILIFSVLFFVVSCAQAPINSQPPPPTRIAVDWKSETKNNLDFLRQKIQEMHPALVLKKGAPERAFATWFERGYQTALKRAEDVQSFQGMYFTIRAYTVGFEDEHLLAGLASLEVFRNRLPLKWPGFVVAANGQESLTVVFNDETASAPPQGSRLKSCGGKSTQQLLEQNVFPFFGSKKLNKNWRTFGPRLFVDFSNPFVTPAKSCVFENQGKTITYQLQWQDIPFDQIWGKLSSKPVNSNAAVRPIGKGHWISLPSFAPGKQMQTELNAVIQELPNLRSSPRLVFDLRGNTGGSSSWGSAILNALYSKDYIDQIKGKISGREIHEYRVSDDAQKYFAKLLGDSSKNISSDNVFFRRVSEQVDAGLKNGLSTIQVPMKEFYVPPTKPIRNPVTARVFVLTDELCFSACLSFMDVVRNIPGTVHVGRATSADSVFMQTLDDIPLFNGEITFTVPVLRIHKRKRGQNEPYRPRYSFANDINDTEAVEKWILTVLPKTR